MAISTTISRRSFVRRALAAAGGGVALPALVPGGVLAADVEIGHRSAILCHLGNIARWTGRKLAWDPQRELFPGDDEANSFLDRPRRKPYELPAV